MPQALGCWRRRLDDRQQGPARAAAHAAHGVAGLGVLRDQLPAQPARGVAGPHRRREAGHRVDPRARQGVRRGPVLHRDHRRLRRRPPRRAGRADARTTRTTSRASRTPTPSCRPRFRSTASTTWPGRPAARRSSGCATCSSAPRVFFERPTPRTPSRSRRRHRCCASARTRRRSTSSTASTTRWSRSARPGRSSRSCARPPTTLSPTASCPAPSTPSTSFPSVRSQHSVRGVDRFLRWAYDSWRGVPTASDEEIESQDPRDD